MDIPIVFFGINDMDRAKLASDNPYMAGSVEKTSLSENIELALSLQPKAKRVVGIVDNTLTGQGDKKQLKDVSEEFKYLEFKALDVSKYSYEEFGAELNKYGMDTIIIFQSMSQDRNGKILNLSEQIEFIKKYTKSPVYRASVGGVGDGLLGGRMIDYEKFGENAARMAVNIMNGTDINSLKELEDTPYYYYFDYKIVEKYNLDIDKFPEESEFLNRDINPLIKYKKIIIYGGIVMFLVLVIVVLLILDNIRRRRLQSELMENHEELTALYEELAASEEELHSQYDVISEHSREIEDLYDKYLLALGNTNSAVWEYDFYEKRLQLSDNHENILGLKLDNIKDSREMLKTIMSDKYINIIDIHIQNIFKGNTDEIDLKIPVNNNVKGCKWLLIKGRGVEGKNQKKINGIILDITDMKKQEEYIDFMAHHDYLTNLLNRFKFMEILKEEIKKNKRGAVLLFDIDNFKNVNDTLGHVYGDELLKSVAKRLDEVSKDGVKIARFGGDEFLILLKNMDTEGEVTEYIERLKERFTEPFLIQDRENYISFSMGVTFYPKDSNDIDQIIMNADTAMYHVKVSGKNSSVFYSDEMKDNVNSRKDIEDLLRWAIKNDGYKLLYEPQVRVIDGEIIGFEALLRLKDHAIGPNIFIPIAEESGHIIEIGRWAAKEAVKVLSDWKKEGINDKVISINYSSKQLKDKGYVEYLVALTKEFEISPTLLEIEITEGILLENNSDTMEFLRELKRNGFNIALDDFGTGYSSLNYLTYIPVDKLKLDKSINDKFLSLEDTKVMDSIIQLGHSLKLKITAEGIETMDKFERLKDCECDYIQGYLFSKPVELEEAREILNKKYEL